MKFQLPYSGLQWSDLPFLLTGILRTILLTIVAAAIGTVIGIILGWLRESWSSHVTFWRSMSM
jgi:ABC-type amino acid transport system permease subunit